MDRGARIVTQERNMSAEVNGNRLREAMLRACRWLVDVAQVKTADIPPEENGRDHRHRSWRGAIRGEYSVADRQWGFFCPVWHTGQAIKALAMAYGQTGESWLLEAARLSASFISAEQNWDDGSDDFGLIHAYEDFGDRINSSAILEALDGLFVLSDVTGDMKYLRQALAALQWVARKAYIPGQGLTRDVYDPREKRFVEIPQWVEHKLSALGRPLIDDAIFLTGYELTGDETFRRIFFETADQLLATENPPGNWIGFGPCDPQKGYIHPRHAYWWGRPMIRAWQASGNEKYLACARRAAEWYRNALRADGGLIRNTYGDFNTDSFGHATSGSACAAILMQDLMKATGCLDYREPVERALRFCLGMQLNTTRDLNLAGVILEKVLPPDGTDRHPFYIRDLGTIFFIQAAAGAMALTVTTASRRNTPDATARGNAS
jgi:hypothetical protein